MHKILLTGVGVQFKMKFVFSPHPPFYKPLTIISEF